jgi:alpha-tubulin suppressor-like RCC1 family protein
MAFNVSGVPLSSTYLKDSDIFEDYIGSSLWGWGYNGDGELALNNITNKRTPTQEITGGVNWKQISGCTYMNAGIKTDGSLWLWGSNYYGQLGNGIYPGTVSSPVQTIAGGTNWKLVSCGNYHTMAIKTDGSLWGWGNNNAGNVGTNNTTPYSSPVQTIAGGNNWKLVAGGQYMTAAIKIDGTLWLWGQNTNGQLGTNNITSYSSPVQTVASGNNWKQVSVREGQTAAIKTDGSLWTWGYNLYGQLGTNNITSYSSPVQTIAGGTNWRQVSCGYQHTVAIKTDGSLWGWGNNTTGNLGDNTVVANSSPIQTIAGGTNWKYVSGGQATTAAIKTDGTLWTWGQDVTYGALGDNAFINQSSPIQTYAGGTNWKQVKANRLNMLAITFTDYQ